MSSIPEAIPLRIRTLWERLAEIYGHRWVSSYGEDAGAGAGLTWAKGLANITAVQLATGISKALASADPWPPTLPAFRSMCLGIPSLAAVKHEIRHPREQRSPFLRQVWEFLDGYAFSHADVRNADRLLADAYQLAAEYVMRGGHLPEPIVGEIEAPKTAPRPPADPAVAKAHMHKIAEMLGVNDEPEEGFCQAQRGVGA